MNYASLYLLLSLIYNRLTSSFQQDTCLKIQCDSTAAIESDICVNIQIDPIKAIVKLKECKPGQYCNVDTEYPSKNSDCVDDFLKPKQLRYEHLPCETNNDCIHKVCNNNICNKTYYEKYTKCTVNSDCPYGESCQFFAYDNICIELAPVGSSCESTEECDLTSSCHNSICTEYFTLKNGEETTDNLLCKSGFVKDSKCSEVFSVNQERQCNYDNKICNYIIDGETKNAPDKCHCSFDTLGTSYCELGESDSNSTAYYDELKKYYSRNTCHSDERGKAPCLKDLLSTTEEVKTVVGQLISKMVWAKKNYLMYKAEPCALKIFFPLYDEKYDDKERIPLDVSCPKYTCDAPSKLPDNEKNTCAKIFFDSFKNISITLYDTCNSNQNCTIDHWNRSLYKTHDIQCNDKQNSIIHYPGEPCNVNEDCINNKCVNKICDSPAVCEDYWECGVGKYCSNKKCKDQLELGDSCNTIFDCQNHHFCYEGTCQDILFTMKDRTDLSNYMLYDKPESICKSGYARNNKCATIISRNYLNKDEDYAECNSQIKCAYKTKSGFDHWKEDCPCSFNANEIRYCPHDHIQDALLRERYLNALKRSYKNKCHTLKRYYCDLIDKGLVNELKMYENKVNKGHFFYKSALCAEKVLHGLYLAPSIIFTIAYFITLLIFI